MGPSLETGSVLMELGPSGMHGPNLTRPRPHEKETFEHRGTHTGRRRGGASGGGDPRVAVKVASRHPEPGWESPAPPLLDLDCGLRTLNEQSLLLKPLRSREEALGEGAQCPGRGCSVPGLDSFHVAGAEGPAGSRRASAGASGLGSPACPLPLASGPGGSQKGAAAGTIARTAETRGGPCPRPPALAAGVGAPSFPRRALSSLPAPCLGVPTGVVEGAR